MESLKPIEETKITAIDYIVGLDKLGAEIVPITNDNIDQAIEFLAQLRKARTDLDKERKVLKQPSLDAGRAVDSLAKKYKNIIDSWEAKIEPMILRIMSPDPVDGSNLAIHKSRGIQGSHASIGIDYEYRVDDIRKVPLMYLKEDHSQFLNRTLLRKYVSESNGVPDEIPGLTIIVNKSVKTRAKDLAI